MKKLLVILALCMVLSVVLVACETPDTPENPTTDNVTTQKPTEAPTTNEPTTNEPTTDEPTTNEPTTDEPTTDEPTTDEPTTDEPTTDEPTTEEPVPDPDPVKTHLSFDECDMWLNLDADLANSANAAGSFFTPGQSSTWDGTANVEDHNISYIRVWGWVGFYADTVGEFGYQIDDQEPVYSADFAWATGDDVVNAAAGTGAKSASRFLILIPVRELSGAHTIKALVKDIHGTVEEITVINMTKAVDPDAPLFVLDAATMAGATNFNEVASITASEDGTYTTFVGANDGQYGDAWVSLIATPTQAAQYIAIKYRTTMNRDGEFFVGSTGAGPTGQGDHTAIDYTSDGKWNLSIVDLSTVEAVNDENYMINFLRYDFFTSGKDDATIDVAYIAAFNSIEAAEAYFAESMVVADNTNTFYSDVDSNEVGTAMGSTDLANFFSMGLPLPGSGVEDMDGAKVYHMTSINEMFANVDGAYYVYSNIVSSIEPAAFVVRGYHVVNSDEVIEKFDPNNGIYKINNYYESDGNPGKCGGAGIYVNRNNDNLQILAKVYNANNITRVDNFILEIPCTGTGLTIADDGYTVYIGVDGVLYATIDLIGAQSYADINEVSPAGQFAAKAIIKTVDNEYVLENTLIAAKPSQVAVVARAGGIKFTSIEVGGFSQILVPEFPAPAGSVENPIFVDFAWNEANTGANATVTVPAGATVYYQGYLNGMILEINGENMGVQTAEYPRMPVVFSITNEGEADAEYTLAISYPAGAIDNPAQLVLGENTVNIEAGNSQGYFFTYTATEAGTLTFTISTEAGWVYAINNLTTGKYGDTQWSDSDPVVNPAVIEVAAGDVIQIMVNTYDPADMWSNPAGTITVTAAVVGAEEPETPAEPVTLIDATYESAIPEQLTYITNNEKYPNPSFYSNGGLKMNYVNMGMQTVAFEAKSSVKVTLNILALNENTKSENADVDAFTFYGLDANGEVVATATLNELVVGDNEVTLAGEGIVAVKVIMTDYYNNGNACCNISVGGLKVVG